MPYKEESEKVKRKNVLLSLEPDLEQLLRDLSHVLYPDGNPRALSQTAEDAIKLLANQAKHQQLLKEYKELMRKAQILKQEVETS